MAAVLALQRLSAAAPCATPGDVQYAASACDQAAHTRTRVPYWTPGCDPKGKTLPPAKREPCGISCKAGSFLPPAKYACAPCTEDTFSLGAGGVVQDQFDSTWVDGAGTKSTFCKASPGSKLKKGETPAQIGSDARVIEAYLGKGSAKGAAHG